MNADQAALPDIVNTGVNEQVGCPPKDSIVTAVEETFIDTSHITASYVVSQNVSTPTTLVDMSISRLTELVIGLFFENTAEQPCRFGQIHKLYLPLHYGSKKFHKASCIAC